MSQFSTPPEAGRPSMRRKSSAQNLLSSFKRTDSASLISGGSAGVIAPQPGSGAPPSSFYGTGSASGHTAGTATPTTATGRDWDVQSQVAESVISSAGTITSTTPIVGVPVTSPALAPVGTGTTLEFLRDLVQKRMVTLTYMRNVHDGRSHWFHTIMMTRQDLDRVFNNVAMKKRTYRFAILGMSLSGLFDIQSPPDLLRGLLNTLSEYEQNREEGERPKMGRLFNRNRTGRRPMGNSDYAMSYAEASETSYLITPHMPFPLDYHQTLLSLLDILSELYHKLSKILGPSPFPTNAFQHVDGLPRSMHPQVMAGPLGAISPRPGVSYLFSSNAPGVPGVPGLAGGMASSAGVDEFGVAIEGSSLWGIANGVPGSAGGMGGANPLNAVPGSSWTPAIGEMVVKIDSKLKKIITTLLKELDQFARNAIKDELATLDPLLRNLAVPEDGREQFDFEGAV